MSDSGKAVFLSYASQDAEAAKRICEALRAAGVEVWFDQNELVGGDAWDQKIRRQIKECALLIPIISQNTQARAEGYFRLEWRLADQRTHLMGKSKAFLLPVTIDGTRDADADVPDSFLAVQWTCLRLSGFGEASPPAGEDSALAKFAARVKHLLDGSAVAGGARPDATADESRPLSAPPSAATKPSASRTRGLAAAGLGLLVVAGVVAWWARGRTSPPVSVPAASSTPAVLSTPELAEIGRILGGRTSIGINRAELTTEKYRLLDELARKAITATPENAEAWAVAAEIDYLHHRSGQDQSRERQAQMNQRMLRAVELDAKNFDVRFVKMGVLARMAQTPAAWQEVVNQLRALKQERPDHEGVLATVAVTQTYNGQASEGAAMLMQLRLYDDAFWAYLRAGDWPRAEEAARKRMEMPGCLNEGIYFLAFVQINGREDLEAGLATLERLPLAARVEDRFAFQLFWVHMLHRDADNAMVALAGLPQDWLGAAPVAHFRAAAHHLAGRNEAAQIEWRQALASIEQRLGSTPNDTKLRNLKAIVLACLGDTQEALRIVEQERQLSVRPVDDLSWSWSVHLLAGNKELVLLWLERELPRRQDNSLRAMARYSEHFDALRGNPRFEKLLRDTLPPGSKPFDETKPLGRQ